MSEFDDVIEKDKKRPSSEEVEEKKEFKRSGSQDEGPSISLSSMLEDEPLLADLTGNINPELKTQVLIPLLNIVEKYGMADNIVASERTQTSLALVGVLSDVAPVIKGLSNYLEGHRNSLNESDKEFLEQLKDLESNDDLEGLFNSENEMVVESPKRQHSLLGELPDVDVSEGPLNWMAILDPEGNFSQESKTSRDMDLDVMKLTTKKEDRPKIRLPSIEDLAAEAGVDLNAIDETTPPPTKTELSSESEITPVKIDEFLDVEEKVSEPPINNNERDIPVVSFDIPLDPRPVQNNPIQEDIVNEEE